MRVTVVFGAQFHELEVDPADGHFRCVSFSFPCLPRPCVESICYYLLVQAGAEIFKIQVTSLTDVAPDRLLISGVGSGFLVCACLCLFLFCELVVFPHGW